MSKLRVGIIGCGRISVVYKEAFKKCSDAIDVTFAMDKIIERADDFAKDFEGCVSSDLFEDTFEQELDVVHICTPHFLHKEQVVSCLNAGINVLTEKPMAINIPDAEMMIRAANKSGKKLGVIFQNRYIEGVKIAKELIDKGKLGNITGAWSLLTWWRPPSYYDCDWKGTWSEEGGGVLIDQAIHSIDLVQYLVGSEVEWIEGHIANRILKNVEVEDVADAAIKFKNGCIYSLFATNYYTNNAPVQIEIKGEKGTISLKGFDVTVCIDGERDRFYSQDSKSDDAKGHNYWGNYHFEQIREFYESTINDSPVFINGSEGKKALSIVLGVYESSKKTKKIKL
ncbi:Gfo/Idh/MocA family protein [Alkalibacter saccharofermentans]|uniref:Predicted dehydrogenase n=1 Tax=Alkalibacter saccharofermentans DSM 14828 TaxID=1120975 RepID=A0A1M4U4P1_9FIRM|nr:Gfo/Idh/MocA family oxidoreductase [Alkalibacter saccharofermentans]SHE51702.1 Predicted dehydrogenase [Alkalibacter saccharofermentans DSM 14828]